MTPAARLLSPQTAAGWAHRFGDQAIVLSTHGTKLFAMGVWGSLTK
jgi:hypothetical protein